MDAMLAIVNARDLQPDDIREIVLYAGSNILNPIRYQTARDELEGKFCLPFLLAAIIRSRKAGCQRVFAGLCQCAPDAGAYGPDPNGVRSRNRGQGVG